MNILFRNWGFTLFMVIFFNMYCPKIFAQSRVDTSKTKNIEGVEILISKTRDVVPVQTLSGDVLQNLNSHSVADALRYFSGVQLKDYGGVGGLKTIDVRSMGSQHVGVFYDGIQLGNAQNGVVDLGKFSLDDLEVISLYNGQKSSIFQPAKDYASASSIYLQSKKPIFLGKKRMNAIARFKTGTIALLNPYLRFEKKISNNLSTSLSTEFLKSNGEYKFRYARTNVDGSKGYDTTAIRKDGQIEAIRLEASLHGNHKGGIFNLKGYTYHSDRGIPGAIVRNQFDARGQTLVDKNYFLQGTYHFKWDRLETKMNLKWAYDKTKYTDTVSKIKVQNQYIQKEMYLSWSSLYKWNSKLTSNVSGDFQYNILDANLKNFSFPTRYSAWLAFSSAYFTDRFSAQGSVLGTFIKEKVELNTKSPDKSVWQPSFIVNYQPFPEKDFSLRFFYKKAFRMPTFNDLYYTNIGYSNLKPEIAQQYNLGAGFKISRASVLKGIELQIDGYYNEVKDKIIAAPNGSMFRWMMMNLGEVRIKGLDLKVKALWGKDLWSGHFSVNYTLQKAQDYSSPIKNYYRDQIPYTPIHSGSVIAQTAFKNWRFNYSFIYVGERYDANQNNIQYNYVEPWYTHDLSVSRDWQWSATKITTSLEANNIMNQYYDVVLNYPMPGRQFKFIISIQL